MRARFAKARRPNLLNAQLYCSCYGSRTTSRRTSSNSVPQPKEESASWNVQSLILTANMKTYLRVVGLCSITFFFCAVVRSERLDWKQKTIELSANARQEKVEAVFPFKNGGDKRVTVQSTVASCDCTVPELEKKVFEPGETGELKAVFKIQGRVGRQEKTITVTTAEEPQSPTVLTLRVNIPELVEIKPRLIMWRVGEDLTEKLVELYLATNPAVTVLGVEPNEPTIQTRLETVVPNRQYRLFLKPTSTAAPARNVVRVKTKDVREGEIYPAASSLPTSSTAIGQERVDSFNIYVQVK